MRAKKIGLIGKKLGMTQIYKDGVLYGVTVFDFSTMKKIGVRTKEKDNYEAVILGCDFKDNKPSFIREVRGVDPLIYDNDNYMSTLESLTKVDVIGIMKGRGFQGGMKRHGFHGGPASHGAKHWHRRVGSVGGHTFPAKTWKGQKMPGRYGGTRVCTLNQKLIMIDKEKKLLYINGSIPGYNNSYVMVRDAIKG